MVFVELGCEEEHLAIARILSSVASSRTALPEAVLATLIKWLHRYADNPAHRHAHMKACAATLRELPASSTFGAVTATTAMASSSTV